ncbi:GEVED domain-containing protein [Flavobacterium sp.]|uniref:GEVED domain-containing protein n=1 Tax=Flavobacterium sp. TaxID=239 RepID=UPI002FDB776D
MKKITLTQSWDWLFNQSGNNIFYTLCVFVLLLGQSMTAQTVLLNPNGDGGFENGSTFADNGWTAINAATNKWTVGSTPGWFSGNAGAFVSNNGGVDWTYTNNQINRSSFYRDIAFPSNALSVTLSFDWRANGNDGNWDNLVVYLMDTSIEPTLDGPVGTATTTTGWPGYTNGTTGYFLLQRNGTVVPTTTTNVTYTLTAAQLAYVAGSTKRLVFVWKNDVSGGTNPPASVDNISVVAFACGAPSALTIAGLTTSSANISWTASPSNPSEGYQYELRTSGAVGSGSTGLVESGNTLNTSLAFSNLTISTSYTLFVRSRCGVNDFSSWISIPFFTNYCIPSSTLSSTYINNFTTTGGSTNISNLASGYTTGGYQDNYNTQTVSQFPTGVINFTSEIVGGTVGTSIWVDWNNDLIFDNATERVFVTSAYGNNQTGSFVVPAGIPQGNYRMRVRIDFNSITPDPCASTNTRTETEDYKLTVTDIPACLPPTNVTGVASSAFSGTVNWVASITNASNGYQYYIATTNTPPTAQTTPSGSVGAGQLSATISDLTPRTIYYVWVRSNCNSEVSDWSLTRATFETECDPPVLTSTTPGSICGQGSVQLAATSNIGITRWYANATGGLPLFVGNNFSTPNISQTTSFWAEATVGPQQTSGKLAPPSTATGSTLTNWGIVFNATESFKLESVSLYSTTAGTVDIKITNSSLTEIYATGSVPIAAGGTTTPNIIPINYKLPAGNGYRILVKSSSGVNLIRDGVSLAFPYVGTDGVVTVTASEWGGTTTSTYYYFYDLKYSTGCSSERVEVVATVNASPQLALSSSSAEICPGFSTPAITLTSGQVEYDTFQWSPASGVSGNSVDGWVFAPTTTTTYTLNASQSAGSLCQTSTTFNVNVNLEPVISASNAEICQGGSANLTANVITTATIGTAETLTSATTQPTAFCNRWDQYWNQTIFTAAELQAAGLSAGTINSITYNITTLGSGTNVTNFSIRIGTTNNTIISAFQTTGLSVVYGPATYNHAIGFNTIVFDTPYVWDGISNIILDVRQDGEDSTNNAITYFTATAQPMTISAITSVDSAVNTLQNLVQAGTAVPSTSLQRLNVIFEGTGDASTVNWLWTPGDFTTSTIAVSPSASTSYTVRATNPTTGCFKEQVVLVTVNTVDAPTGESNQAFQVDDLADATIADLVVTGNDVEWYASEADALNGANALTVTTQLVNGQTYYAVQTSDQGCRSASFAVTVTVTLGANSFDLAGLKYYPNPVTNVLQVEYTAPIVSLELYNMIGQKVSFQNVNALQGSLEMGKLPTGTYFVKVQTENASKTIKIVKN